MVPSKNRSTLVSIEQRAEKTGSKWGNDFDWTEFGQAWVSITPNRGREVFRGQGQESEVSHTIRGDWVDLENVQPEMRIVLTEDMVYPATGAARYFDIHAVMHDEDHHRDTMIKAREVDKDSVS